MKKNPFKEIIVWLIICAGLFIFSSFVYIIGSNKGGFFKPSVIYKTLLEESSGIHVGTKISIHGKNTGNVVKTTLLPDGKVEVRFTVRKDHIFSLTEASVTELKNSGALGDRFINITTPDLSAKQLKKGALIPHQESSSLLSVLTGDGGDTKQSVQNIIKEVRDLLENINSKGVSGFLSKSHQEDLTQILKSMKNILKKVDSGKGTLGALVNDRSLYNRLLVLLGQRPKNNYIQELSRKSQKSGK